MPDLFAVNSSGLVVEFVRDRSDAVRRIYGMGYGPCAIVYTGDVHDVQSQPRIEPVKRAAEARRRAWFDSFRLCVECGLDEDDHFYSDLFGPTNDDACGCYQRPMPLVVKS